MPSEPRTIRLLLDAHYPAWLADELTAGGLEARAAIADQELAGADDTRILAVAAAESRAVVTEDVATFHEAIRHVPDHCGVVFCHHARFPRRAARIHILRDALIALAADPPAGLGELPVEYWLPAP